MGPRASMLRTARTPTEQPQAYNTALTGFLSTLTTRPRS
jgi:hypothetical protein